MCRDDETMECPRCGAEASGRREISRCFSPLYRPQPRDGMAYPQLYRCRSCGLVFGEPYPIMRSAACPVS